MKINHRYNGNKDKLSTLQIEVARELATKYLTGKREEDIAKEYGINRSTIWRWKSLPAFENEVSKSVKDFQKSHLPEVHSTLIKILRNGSDKDKLKAIELYYKNQGLLRDKQEIVQKQEVTVNVDDILQELEGLE
ncbi:phBC6A51 family helix-turn-helix protein [Clostridium tyrobutyricum]|uniref:phBC6A51 family helix-turn-helix protein n=1 Tax=Clostridium tyrobutyricum TaxID=1519 RepID=UPI0030CE67F1